MTWEGLAVALVACMVPFATVNPILYGQVADWRRSPEGRALMHMFIVLAFLIDAAVLYSIAPTFPGKDVVAVVIYGAILASLIRFTVVLGRVLRHQRKRA